MTDTIRDEFVVGIPGKGIFRIEDLDYYDEILREEDATFWRNVRKGFVEVFTPIQKKYESEPELIKIAKLPVDDVRRKFG